MERIFSHYLFDEFTPNHSELYIQNICYTPLRVQKKKSKIQKKVAFYEEKLCILYFVEVKFNVQRINIHTNVSMV
jgi:hypothetical protein